MGQAVVQAEPQTAVMEEVDATTSMMSGNGRGERMSSCLKLGCEYLARVGRDWGLEEQKNSYDVAPVFETV